MVGQRHRQQQRQRQPKLVILSCPYGSPQAGPVEFRQRPATSRVRQTFPAPSRIFRRNGRHTEYSPQSRRPFYPVSSGEPAPSATDAAVAACKENAGPTQAVAHCPGFAHAHLPGLRSPVRNLSRALVTRFYAAFPQIPKEIPTSRSGRFSPITQHQHVPVHFRQSFFTASGRLRGAALELPGAWTAAVKKQ